jgi:murein DD-endopeptidase MepM/ murein hydrolase activator NlpD
MHCGVDFAGRMGLNVYATGDGVVSRTRVSRVGFGKEVTIDHGFGYSTRYGHLENILVHVGQKVKRGNIIGTLGNTGRSTGPHLHYEVQHYSRAKNPKHFYSEDLSPDEYQEIVSLPGTVDN